MPKCDHAEDEMQQRSVIFCFLFPTDENPSESIEPAVGAFHHPTSWAIARSSPACLGLFTPCPDMGNESRLFDPLAYLRKIIPLVQAQMDLVFALGWIGDWHTVHRLLEKLHIVAVGSRHGHAQNYSASVAQETPFDSAFAAIGGIGTGFFFLPTAPWFGRHRHSASSSRSLSVRHTPSIPFARNARIHRPSPIPGNGHGPSNPGRCSSHPELSTDNLCAGQRRSRPYSPDQDAGGDRHQNGEYSCAQESVASSSPTAHQVAEIVIDCVDGSLLIPLVSSAVWLDKGYSDRFLISRGLTPSY